ncbi:MAG: hypothetical protein ACR2K6_07840 [Solirubrobacterales bacterium]
MDLLTSPRLRLGLRSVLTAAGGAVFGVVAGATLAVAGAPLGAIGAFLGRSVWFVDWCVRRAGRQSRIRGEVMAVGELETLWALEELRFVPVDMLPVKAGLTPITECA